MLCGLLLQHLLKVVQLPPALQGALELGHHCQAAAWYWWWQPDRCMIAIAQHSRLKLAAPPVEHLTRSPAMHQLRLNDVAACLVQAGSEAFG